MKRLKTGLLMAIVAALTLTPMALAAEAEPASPPVVELAPLAEAPVGAELTEAPAVETAQPATPAGDQALSKPSAKPELAPVAAPVDSLTRSTALPTKPTTGATQTFKLDGSPRVTDPAFTCGKFRLDGWAEATKVYWRAVVGSDYGETYTITMPRRGSGWGDLVADFWLGSASSNPAASDMPPHGYSWISTQPTVDFSDDYVTVKVTMKKKEYFNVTFVAPHTATDATGRAQLENWLNIDKIVCDAVPPFEMVPGNNSSKCVVDWTAGAFLDQDLPDYSNNGYTKKVSRKYFNDPGTMEMQHWIYGGNKIYWRIPIGTDYAMTNAVVTVDLPEGFNYQAHPITNGWFDPDKDAYPNSIVLGPSQFSVADGKLTVNIGDLPDKSRTIFYIVGDLDGTRNPLHDTYYLEAHLTAMYVKDLNNPDCMTPPEPTSTPTPTPEPSETQSPDPSDSPSPSESVKEKSARLPKTGPDADAGALAFGALALVVGAAVLRRSSSWKSMN